MDLLKQQADWLSISYFLKLTIYIFKHFSKIYLKKTFANNVFLYNTYTSIPLYIICIFHLYIVQAKQFAAVTVAVNTNTKIHYLQCIS